MARRKKTARSAEFKAKVALASLADGKTVQQISALYDVHRTRSANHVKGRRQRSRHHTAASPVY